MPGTICAAIESTSRFDAVTDNFAAAMGAARSERVNRTFKTVEHMRAAAHPHLEALVVLVSAHFTLPHLGSPPPIVHGSLVENTRDVFRMRFTDIMSPGLAAVTYVAPGAMIAILMQAKQPPVKEPPVKEPPLKRPPEKDPTRKEPPRREPPNPEPPIEEPPRQPPAEEPPPEEPPIQEPQT